MNVKTDTKEKFTVIVPLEKELPANMAGELKDLLKGYMGKSIPHLVLNLENVGFMEEECGQIICAVQQSFYEHMFSFVICSLQPAVEASLDGWGYLEMMNITPTESEAWDILQMEDIERELLG